MKKPFSKKRKSIIFDSAKKLSSQGKLLLFAAGTAICIGLLLGVISLQMTKQEAKIPDAGTVSNQVVSSEKKVQTYLVDGFDFFVIQGGVFSHEDNANTQAKQFKRKNYKTFNWEKDGNVYLLAGIASDEKSAETMADQMDKQKLDVYVKKWEITEVELKSTAEEIAWIEDFFELWQKTVQLMDKGNTPPQDKWKALMSKNITDETDHAFIADIKNNWKKENEVDAQLLLDMIYSYQQQIHTK